MGRWWLVVIACAIAFGFATSFHAWKQNSHQQMLKEFHPSWIRGEYVLFDGYGDYSDLIGDWLRGMPGSGNALARASRTYVHSNTPVYPALTAVVSLTGVDTVWAGLLVTVASSALCLGLFWMLLRQRCARPGAPEYLCFVSFALHVSIVSGLARPLPDMLALAAQLGVFLTLRDFAVNGSRRSLILCAVLCVAGTGIKTIMVLTIPLALACLLVYGARNRGATPVSHALRLWWIWVAGVLVILAVAALVLRDSQSLRFLLDSTRHSLSAWKDPVALLGPLKAGILFAVLAFGLYPLVIAAGWRRTLPREELEHFLWIALYVAQRLYYMGFNVHFGRARYGIPLAASVLILALPGFRRLWASPRTRGLAVLPAVFHVAVWLYFLATLK